MSLGENINRLRTERNMSQGDLADALEVSRQSISKWETDGSVPELDKLTKLAELFGVSLDELVKGEKTSGTERPKAVPFGPTDGASASEAAAPFTLSPPQSAAQVVVVERRGMSVRTAVAIVLFCLAFAVTVLFMVVGQFLAGIIFALPFLICGAICILAKKHPWLWCVWTLFLLADIYLRWAAGLNWSMVRWTLWWEESWNYTRLAIAWCQFLCGLALPIGTAVRLGKKPMEWTKRNKILFALGCAGFVLLSLPVMHNGLFQWGGGALIRVAGFLGYLFDSLRLILLSALLTALARGRKKR